VPKSGLERAAAASAVAAGSDPSGGGDVLMTADGQQQQQTVLEARLKRITDTLHKVRGPEFDPNNEGDNVKSERLVVADRPPSYQAGAAQSPYMMRNDEIVSSGDGALGDDDEEGDDGNGDFGSGGGAGGDGDGGFEEPPFSPRTGGHQTQPTDGVYPVDVEERTTKKSVLTTTTKRVPGHHHAPAGKSAAGVTRKPYIESEHRHPTTTTIKSKPAGSSSSSSYRTSSLWLRSMLTLFVFILSMQNIFFTTGRR